MGRLERTIAGLVPAIGQSTLAQGRRELNRYQAMSLQAKIRYSLRLIEVGLELARRPAVAWSGGKDSTVLMHLVLQFEPHIDVIFNNTQVEYPETYRFVRELKQAWQVNLHVAKPEPGKNFWWCVEQFGWPLLGKDAARDIGAIRRSGESAWKRGPSKIVAKAALSDVPIAERCCYYLKEKPARRMYRALGVDLIFLGMMAHESDLRFRNWVDYGDFFWTKHDRLWKCHPLSIWTDGDVWEYHRRHDIPHAKLYDMGYRRNGCWPCGMGIRFGAFAELRRGHPKLFRFLMVDKGLGAELVKLKLALNDGQYNIWAQSWKIEQLLDQRPCFFDKL